MLQESPGVREDAPDVAWAALFCAFLKRRTPLPLAHNLRFPPQFYRVALGTDWVHRANGFRYLDTILHRRGAEACGLDTPLAQVAAGRTCRDAAHLWNHLVQHLAGAGQSEGGR